MIITSFLLPCINNFQVFQYVLVLCFFSFLSPSLNWSHLKAYFNFGQNNEDLPTVLSLCSSQLSKCL